jgi:sulfate adenylyltransferase subunit 1 (EFTu-like GTPase family)
MDLVDFRENVFSAIRDEFTQFAAALDVHDIQFIPISALDGDNVVHKSKRTPWYQGPALLEHLESVPLAHDRDGADFRFPVQCVIRPNLNFRGFAGQISAGTVRRGDRVKVLPSGRMSRVKSIVTWDGDLEEAFAPMSVTICLEDEIDVSRGDMLVPAARPPENSHRFETTLVWMDAKPLHPHQPYLLKHTTQTVQARIREIRNRVDVNTLERHPAAELGLNEIGVVTIETQRPLFFDPYSRSRSTGSFILIDPLTNATSGAGMIRQSQSGPKGEGRVTAKERENLLGHSAFAICLPAGNEAFAYALERHLFDSACSALVIDEAEYLEQAVRTAFAGGLIAILAPRDAEEWQSAIHDLPADRVVFVQPDQIRRPNALESLRVKLRAEGWLGRQADPLVDGGGI